MREERSRALKTFGTTPDLRAKIVLGKRSSDLSLFKNTRHEPLPHRFPAGCFTGLFVDVALTSSRTEQPRCDMDRAVFRIAEDAHDRYGVNPGPILFELWFVGHETPPLALLPDGLHHLV